MTNLSAALDYAARGLPVFPVRKMDDGRKVPLTAHGYKDASADHDQIKEWLTRWPTALVATPTGRATDMVVLDVDVKNGVHGWDALEDLGALPLPHSPHAHTPSGGCHIYFRAPAYEVRCSAGKIGRGLDVRGDGGSIILPAPVGGYTWDPHLSLDAVPLAPMPPWLVAATRPRPVEPIQAKAPDYLMPGLSRYGEAALDGAGRDIIAATAGAQESTLNGRAHWIGQLVAGGEIPRDLARDALVYAASMMTSHDPGRPWRLDDIAKKINAALDAGAKKPASPPVKERKHA